MTGGAATIMKKYIYCYSMLALLSVWQAFAGDSNANEWGAATNNLAESSFGN